MRNFTFGLCLSAVAVSMTVGSTRAADLTCARTAYSGLICLGEEGITSYSRSNSPLRYGRATDIAACGAKIAVLVRSKIYLFDGKRWGKPIDIVARFARRITCGPKGAIWVLGPKSAASWNGQGWKVHSREQMFGDDAKKAGFLGSVAAGPNGKALVLGSRMAALYDGKAWSLFKAGKGFAKRTFLSKAFFDTGGAAWIAGLRGLMTLKNGKWETVPGPRGTSFLTGTRDGAIWVGSGQTVFRIADGRVNRMQINAFGRSGSVDARGRFWLGTNSGIRIYEGGKWQTRQMHNSDLPDNSIIKVVAVGNGGVLPPAKAQPTGAIKGRMEWQDGGKIAGARMEVCGTPRWILRRSSSPCAGKRTTYRTRTDSDGKFEIKDVKSAIYRIAIKPEGNTRWILVTLGRRGKVEPGKTKDTGTIRLSVRNKK